MPEGCLVVFGGHTSDCSIELGVVEVLDLQTWEWHPREDIQGQPPTARHGHTAAVVEVDSRGYLVIIGGGMGNILADSAIGPRSTNHQDAPDVAVLDLQAWRWVGVITPGWRGALPPFGRHHVSSEGLNGQIFLFGGASRSTNKVLSLDCQACVRSALRGGTTPPEVKTIACHPDLHQPVGRKMHGGVCLLPVLPAFLIFGGWSAGPHFDDLWVLHFAKPNIAARRSRTSASSPSKSSVRGSAATEEGRLCHSLRSRTRQFWTFLGDWIREHAFALGVFMCSGFVWLASKRRAPADGLPEEPSGDIIA